jgi:hypothetical protein
VRLCGAETDPNVDHDPDGGRERCGMPTRSLKA